MLLELPSNFKKPDASDAGPEIEMACDWIESSVLFSGESVSVPTLVDFLEESAWFTAAGDARFFVDEVMSRLKSRQQAESGRGSLKFTYQQVEPKIDDWRNAPAHAFCLLLSYARDHADWNPKSSNDYNLQGEIFELLTCNALSALLPTWDVFRTGWSSTKTKGLPSVVDDVAKRLCGTVGNLDRWNKKQSKEQGLDIVCYRPFHDARGNFPAFFVQCASGKNFISKLKDPDLAIWNDLLRLVPASLPRKAFATPFMLPKKQFEQHAIRGEGLLLDRGRLLSSAMHVEKWLDPKVAEKIYKWAKPYVRKLPWTR